jgi:hypothetical protein
MKLVNKIITNNISQHFNKPTTFTESQWANFSKEKNNGGKSKKLNSMV